MSHLCERLVAAAKYLQENGMSIEQLRALHHSPRRDETFASTYRYFGQNKDLQENNINYAARLTYVADELRKGQSSISVLVGQALERWPL